jgi:cysteine desulfurase
MWADNEVGTVQPVAQVVELAHAHGIPVHTDAAQAVGQLPIDFAVSGVDALTLTAHKLGGPFGVGALLVRREVELVALLHGERQERGVRSGTLDAPSAAGFAAAVRLAVERQPEHSTRVGALRNDLLRRVT